MTNETARKFGYPNTLVREYDHWVVLVRPAQVTVGSLILAAKAEATRFPDLPDEAFVELRTVAGHIEQALAGAFGCDKLNYLMLMMVDPHVHYHVIPRYQAPVQVDGRGYPDTRWPGPPDVTQALDLEEGELDAIGKRLEDAWPD